MRVILILNRKVVKGSNNYDQLVCSKIIDIFRSFYTENLQRLTWVVDDGAVETSVMVAGPKAID